MKNKSNEINLLLQFIETAYDKTAWQGRNLLGSIRRVHFEEAAWRPGKNRHNIWEIVVHAAYWKYSTARRLLRINETFFPYKGTDWFSKPDINTEEEWKKDKKILDDMHKLLLKGIAEFNPKNLYKTLPNGKTEAAALIYGTASHDVYHTGQIQLIKRLYKKN